MFLYRGFNYNLLFMFVQLCPSVQLQLYIQIPDGFFQEFRGQVDGGPFSFLRCQALIFFFNYFFIWYIVLVRK